MPALAAPERCFGVLETTPRPEPIQRVAGQEGTWYSAMRRQADVAQWQSSCFVNSRSRVQIPSSAPSRAEVAERQTRYVQGVVSARACGFKSHLRHHLSFPPHATLSACGSLTDEQGRRAGWSLWFATEESPGSTERGVRRKPEGGFGLHSPRPSVNGGVGAWFATREQQKRDPHGDVWGETGNPPCCNLRIGRTHGLPVLTVTRRDRKSRAAAKATTRPVVEATERDDHHEQNPAYERDAPRMVPIVQW